MKLELTIEFSVSTVKNEWNKKDTPVIRIAEKRKLRIFWMFLLKRRHHLGAICLPPQAKIKSAFFEE